MTVHGACSLEKVESDVTSQIPDRVIYGPGAGRTHVDIQIYTDSAHECSMT